MTDLSTWEGCWRQAQENANRDTKTLEHQCRAVARVLGTDPEGWLQHIDVVVGVECGRLMAVHADEVEKWKDPEYRERYRNYMMNR